MSRTADRGFGFADVVKGGRAEGPGAGVSWAGGEGLVEEVERAVILTV